LYPSWYKERWTVVLDTWVSLFSLNLVVTSFNGVLRSLRTSLTSTLVSLSSSKRWRPVWGLFSTDPLVKWAREKLHWRIEGQWDRVIFSDKSHVVVGKNNQIYIWQKKDEAESRDCVCPPPQRTLSVMIWGCISHYDVGTITTVNGMINRHKYKSDYFFQQPHDFCLKI
jgi:hypothetical protein